MASKTLDPSDSNSWFYENRPPLLIRGSRAILPQISALQNKSAIVLAAGVPSAPRRQEEIRTHPPAAKPEATAAQKALIELRSLHGQKHAFSLLHLQRSSTNSGVRVSANEALKPPSRGRKPFKSGLLKDSRNVNESETIKHLMHQLSELNNITYKREISGGSGSFCSEITLQSRADDIPSASGKGLRPQTTKDYSTSEESRGIRKSHNVMKLIERQILRDLTRHIQRNSDNKQSYSSPDTKTHSDELPGEMKVVIKKTARKGGKSSKSGDVTKSRRSDVTLPFITKTAPANMLRKQPEKYEWSLDERQEFRTEPKTMLPTMKNIMTVQGQSAPPVQESTTPTTPTTSSRKLKARLHGDNIYSGLPRIQEEPDGYSPLSKISDRITTRDVGTSVTPMSIKESSPTSESPEGGKVKLPILGKSIGQQREVTSENGGKFIKPSIGEIKRIIHGLYGDYFDFTLDRYYTYENQFNEPKAAVDLDTPLHFVTPALDESKTPAGSHTLQLFKSAKNRGEESHVKVQKMSAPLLRSKYGKAIASINRSTERASAMVRNGFEQTDHAKNDNQPVVDMDYMSFLRDQKSNIIPNTPNERALRNHIAYQVALYHEQIARENNSLQQSHAPDREPNNSRYMAENKETTMTLAQFAEDIDRYALYLEAYVEAKKKQAEERKVKLLEFRKRQRKNKDSNRHLEIVENRDAFLAQVAISKYQKQMPITPETPANTISVNDGLESVADFRADNRSQKSPIIKKASKKEVGEEKQEPKTDKHAMGTKVYRIFGERQSSASSIRRWVAQAPVTYSSRLIKRQVSRNTKKRPKATQLPNQTISRIKGAMKPHVMTDFVSRFRVATKYKLDRQYVASLASGTM